MFWKKSKSKPALLQSDEMLRQQQIIEKAKKDLASSHEDLTSAIGETVDKISSLQEKLRSVKREDIGIIFVAYDGRVLHVNNLALMILKVDKSEAIKVNKLVYKDVSETIDQLTEKALSCEKTSLPFKKLNDGRIISNSPVKVEFNNATSAEVIIKAVLADPNPKSKSDVIFICRIKTALKLA